jgi:dTDP-4-dehydrorhamnose reductase
MKIILFGSNGMLGNYIQKYFYDNLEVIPLTRKDYDLSHLNSSTLENMLVNEKGFEASDIIINCAGVIPQSSKERMLNSKLYFTVNSMFPVVLSQICDKIGSKMIHITTDCVFSGKDGNYNENSIHDEVNDYGMSKSLGELCKATIIRTSIIGEEINNKHSLLEWVKSNKGKEINGFVNHFWNGVTCLQLAEIIHKIIRDNLYWKGVRHIFSPKSVSKYELINMINEVYNLNIDVIPYETEKVDKTLTTIYDTNDLFDIPDLKEQIIKINTKQQFFIIGCIRSGTSFLCDMFIDFLPKVYNETGVRDIVLRHKLIGNENFAFKYCEDFDNVNEIKQLFNQCKIFLIIRDIRDVINSIYLPNEKSIPPNSFPAVDIISKNENVSRFEAALRIVHCYYLNIIECLENYYNLIDEIVKYENLISDPNNLKNLFDKYFVNKKDIEYYKSKVFKTPNQYSYLNWNDEQKNIFKLYSDGYLNKLLIKFKYVECENW